MGACLDFQISKAMKPPSIAAQPSESPEKGALVSEAKVVQMKAKQGKASTKSTRSPNASFIAEANHVMFGRGKGCTNNPGNQRMRRIVRKYKSQYFGATRGEKRKLITKAHDEIVEGGVKFLKQVGGEDEWVEVESALAIQKVGNLLRDRACYKGNIEESSTKHKGGTRFQNEISTESTSGFRGVVVGGSSMLQIQQQIPSTSTARRLRDELLRRAIAQQQPFSLGLAVLPNPTTSLLAQQLELERFRVLPWIGRRATMGPAAGALQALQAIEQEEELLRIIASRRSIFR